ncbi:hypothetical protein F5144DRAFT_337576 [Chaetomium tenue]|uniref:Uncharacterized protein n=1 Tax=Chaetomium tenue TaxID=1854479 RepID=A0ACB7NX66_9PEZI|nr:hypothetical protein F5144DRAFT_337576 [Chaetomium globosum]
MIHPPTQRWCFVIAHLTTMANIDRAQSIYNHTQPQWVYETSVSCTSLSCHPSTVNRFAATCLHQNKNTCQNGLHNYLSLFEGTSYNQVLVTFGMARAVSCPNRSPTLHELSSSSFPPHHSEARTLFHKQHLRTRLPHTTISTRKYGIPSALP